MINHYIRHDAVSSSGPKNEFVKWRLVASRWSDQPDEKLYLFLFSRSIIVTLEDKQTPEVICIGRIHSRHGLSVWDGLSVGKFASARKEKEDLSPIYTTEKKGSHKKVGTDQIFLPCKPSVPCFHEMDPDLLFSVLGAIGVYGPKPPKTSPDPFCCSKALCKRIFLPYHLLHVSLPCFTVVSRMSTFALFHYSA